LTLPGSILRLDRKWALLLISAPLGWSKAPAPAWGRCRPETLHWVGATDRLRTFIKRRYSREVCRLVVARFRRPDVRGDD
jgi:hypothetical protein